MAIPATRRTAASLPSPVEGNWVAPLPVFPGDEGLLPVLPVDEELLTTGAPGHVVVVVVVAPTPEPGTVVVVVELGPSWWRAYGGRCSVGRGVRLMRCKGVR